MAVILYFFKVEEKHRSYIVYSELPSENSLGLAFTNNHNPVNLDVRKQVSKHTCVIEFASHLSLLRKIDFHIKHHMGMPKIFTWVCPCSSPVKAKKIN